MPHDRNRFFNTEKAVCSYCGLETNNSGGNTYDTCINVEEDGTFAVVSGKRLFICERCINKIESLIKSEYDINISILEPELIHTLVSLLKDKGFKPNNEF